MLIIYILSVLKCAYTLRVKKQDTLHISITLQNIDQFSSSFTARLTRKFATKWALKLLLVKL